MKKPLVSVITVVFNGAATLEDTIRSVAGQTFRDLEYIIVDGGSRDATPDIIKKYPDAVTRWISEPDKGVYDAMNKGIRMAEGEWLYFLGSDDLFQDSGVLACCFGGGGTTDGAPRPVVPDAASLAEWDLVYGDVLSSSYKGRYDGVFTYEKLLSRNLSHQAAFYRKSLFVRLGDYNQRYRMHADWDFNLRCFSDPAVRTHYNGVLVATFGAEGVSAGHDLVFLRERLIPAKLQWLERKGYKTLRRLRVYDEWWRLLRNAGVRDSVTLKELSRGEKIPEAVSRMAGWQQRIPVRFLKVGFFSKCTMIANYITNLLTASL